MNPTIFGAQLLAGVQAVLPYIGAGVAGGAVVLIIVLGIRKGFHALRYVAEDHAGTGEPSLGWKDHYDAAVYNGDHPGDAMAYADMRMGIGNGGVKQ